MNKVFASINAASAVLNYDGGHHFFAAFGAALVIWFAIEAIREQA